MSYCGLSIGAFLGLGQSRSAREGRSSHEPQNDAAAHPGRWLGISLTANTTVGLAVGSS